VNILLLCPRVPWPLNDGGNIAMYRMATLLAAAGNRVTIFALNTLKHHTDSYSLPEMLRTRIRIIDHTIDTTVRPMAAFLNLFRPDESYNVIRFMDASADAALQRLLEEESFDLVQFESVFTGPYLETVRRRSNAICVLRAHNVEHLIWERLSKTTKQPIRSAYLGFLSRRLKKYENQLFRKMDGILPVTEVDERIITSCSGGIPSVTAPVSIEIPRIAEPSITVNASIKLFHLGSMDWQPNNEGVRWFLREVWPLVHARFPDLSLHLAGRSFPDDLRTAAFPMVKCEGVVPDADVYMEDKQLMLVPLRSGSGMRVKILQGLAHGKTVISTSIGAEGIAVKDGRDILIADTPEQFMEKIGYCLSDPKRCLEIGAAGRSLVQEKYSDDAVQKVLLPFYQRLIENQLSIRIV
jgi:glycosyltransferase involved in cell wall biosynthesis